MVLRPEGTQLRRYVAFGASTGSDFLLYGECIGACTAATDWLPLTTLHQGAQLPTLAIDSAGAPRIAYYNYPTAAVRYAWCTSTSPPCTSAAQWSDTLIQAGGQLQSVKIGADDRARVAYSDSNGVLQLATETAPGSGAFTIAALTDCGGPLSGSSPSLWLGPQDRYRVAFTNGQTAQYTQQSP